MPTTKPILLINSIPTITIANYQNIMQLGIEYKYKFNSKLQMKFAVSGEKSGYGYISYKVIDPMLDWFSGLNLRYMNLILGINHGYNNNYNTLYKNKPFNFNNITYKFGPFNFNLIQVKSKNTTKSIFDEKQINFTNQYFLTQYNYNNKINYYIQGGIIKISGVKTQNNAACGINIKF
jgi:hypothetical protein